MENGKKGNPCDAATGNKFQTETDFTGGQGVPVVHRHYNSGLASLGFVSHQLTMGRGWTGTYLPRFETNGSLASVTQLTMRRADGKGIPFYRISGGWETDADLGMRLTEGGGATLTLTLRDGTVERYGSSGNISSITDPTGLTTTFTPSGLVNIAITGPFGHRLMFGYSSGRIATVTDSDQKTISYNYDADNNLSRVDYPDSTARIYHYENLSYPNFLTGISYASINPDGSLSNISRYSTYEYNSVGKAISTRHAETDNGAPQEEFTFNYNNYYTSSETTVTSAPGSTTAVPDVMTFAATLGVQNLVSKVNSIDGKSLNQTFDSSGNLICKKDEENRVTLYSYNSTNQRASMTEGLSGTDCNTCLANPANCNVGGVGRVTTYGYLSPTLDLPRFIRRPSVASGQTFETELVYGDTNHPSLPTQIIQRGFTPASATVSRTVTLGYNASGQVNSLNGPRTDVSDVTALEYYECTTGGACGQMKKVTNALGHITTYDLYDGNGRLLLMTDPNGLRTGYTYDARGRVKTVTQTPASGPAAVTQYSYTPWGDVSQVIDPDGVVLNYQYDAAHYLQFIVDAVGNYIHYKYDLKGNRTGEDIYDSGGNLKRAMGYAYDLRNHLSQINNAGNITQLVHDAVGNLITETDPNNNPPSQHTPDALNRLVQTIDRLGGTTGYGYDINNRLKQMTAPNNAATVYEVDDLGNLLKEISPDRGTINYTYDAAGNTTSVLTARGHLIVYSYDALNRLTFADAPGSDFDATYVYDTCTNGIGRLCSVSNSFSTVTYGYDGLGNVTGHQSLGYTYTAAGRLRTISYPSSAIVTHDYDTAGQVSQVTLTRNGATQVIASGIQYMPFGPIKAMNYGNGKTLAQTWDSAYRVRLQTVPGVLQLDYAQYDGNGNLQQRLDAIAAQWSNFAYDPLDRLDTASGGFGGRDYDHDGNGNRTRLTEGAVVTNYGYTPNTNRLTQAGTAAVTVDASGNVTAQGNRTYVYTPGFDYLAQVLDNGNQVASYTYNGVGQRVAKQTGSITTSYAYGLDGFLRVETPQGGTPREYIYLDGQPLAVLEPASGMLGVQPGYPQVNFNYNGTGTRYDAGTGAFQVDSQPIEFKFQASDDPYLIFGTLAIRIRLNDACHVASGEAGHDLIVTGDVYDPNTFDLVLSGTLLTGEIVAAGAVSYTTNTAGFDFRFTATGGLLVTEGHWPAGQDIGVVLTSTNSNFPGHCAASFTGGAQGIVGPIAPPSPTQAGPLYYYHNDHRGTPQVLTDSNGGVVWKASYDPFGQATITTQTITNNLRDAGMYADAETGLYYGGARYWDPKIGRSISVEPMGVIPGVGDSPRVPREITKYFQSIPLNERLQDNLNHPYAYAYNNPLTYIDPDGLRGARPPIGRPAGPRAGGNGRPQPRISTNTGTQTMLEKISDLLDPPNMQGSCVVSFEYECPPPNPGVCYAHPQHEATSGEMKPLSCLQPRLVVKCR